MSLKSGLLSQFSCNLYAPRIRDVRQGEVAECGLAALASLMSAHGADVPMERLRAMAASTLYGTSLRTLREIAIRIGFEAKARRIEAVAELADAVPCVVHLNFIHFAVVEQVTAREVVLSDPITGPTRMPIDRFSRAFTGIALTLRPTPFLQKGPAIVAPSRRGLLRSNAMRTGLAAAAGSGAALSVAAIAAGARFEGSGGLALPLVALVAALLLAELAIRWTSRATAAVAGAEQAATIDHVDGQPTAALVVRSPVQANALISAPSGLIDPGLIGAGIAAASGLAMLAGAVIAVPAMGLTGVAMVAVEAAAVSAIVLRRGAAAAHLRWQPMPVRAPNPGELLRADSWGLGRGGETLFQSLAGSHASNAAATIPGAERGAALAGLRAGFAGLRLLALIEVAEALLAGGGAAGAMLAAGALAMLAGAQIGRAAAGLRTPGVTSALHRLADRAPAQWGAAPADPPAGVALRLDAVAWRPAAMLDEVVAGVSLSIPAGGSLALTGPPRSGATTIARLAAGWLSPTAGTVAAGPTVMLGTVWPFEAGRIGNVIAPGGGAADAEKLAAIDAVGLGDAIAARGGLGLKLSAGAPELSGGQRRRLMLVAALLRQPGLLVLDGTLEALGTASAAQMLALLRDRGIAVLLAGHRADIAALCDARYALAERSA